MLLLQKHEPTSEVSSELGLACHVKNLQGGQRGICGGQQGRQADWYQLWKTTCCVDTAGVDTACEDTAVQTKVKVKAVHIYIHKLPRLSFQHNQYVVP